MTTTLKIEHGAQQQVIEDLQREVDTLKKLVVTCKQYNETLQEDLKKSNHFAEWYRKQINLMYEKGLNNVKL